MSPALNLRVACRGQQDTRLPPSSRQDEKEANKNDKHGEHGDEHVDDEHGDGDGGDDCGGGNAVGNSVSADDDGHDGNGGDIGVVAMVWNCTTLFPFPALWRSWCKESPL